jgi:hypothetical protein
LGILPAYKRTFRQVFCVVDFIQANCMDKRGFTIAIDLFTEGMVG